MPAWLRSIHALALGLVLSIPLLASQPAATQAQTAGCSFQLGFKVLHDMTPDTVGQCIENEWHNPFNGDGLQRTTHGLEVWRKIDNWTAFTDGYTTWINGPYGLQARLNSERFPWEPIAAEVPAPPPPDQSSTSSAGGGVVPAPAATATPTPGPGKPSISLGLSDDRVDQGESFTVRLEGGDDAGVETIFWWATSTSDNNLRDTHSVNCRGSNPCRRNWDESTTDTGTITIHAKSRNVNGVESDEVSQDLRVREVSATSTPGPTNTPAPTSTNTPAPTSTKAP